MALSTAFVIIAAIIILIYILIEVKRMKHKLFALLLIGLIIFASLTFSLSLENRNIDLGTTSGIIEAGRVYLSWLGGAFVKAKEVTTYAIGLDWKESNSSVVTNKSSNNSKGTE